jgi:phage terminase large subunit-like protein
MQAKVLTAACLSLALSALLTSRAAEDPPADPTLAHDQAKAVGEAVKRDAKVIAEAAKTGAKQVAAAAKEVAAATQEGAQQVGATAKKGAEKAKAAVKGEKPPSPSSEKTPAP